LLEEMVYDSDAQLLTGSLADYLIPTAADMPTIEIIHRETLFAADCTRGQGLGRGRRDCAARSYRQCRARRIAPSRIRSVCDALASRRARRGDGRRGEVAHLTTPCYAARSSGRAANRLGPA